MILIIPNNPFHEVKNKYIGEIMAAQKAGFNLASYSVVTLKKGIQAKDKEKGLQLISDAFSEGAKGMPPLIPQKIKTYAISRGFTLLPNEYAIMYNFLLKHYNIELIEDAKSYEVNYSLPLYYPYLQDAMPKCSWIYIQELGISHLNIYETMEQFNGKPVVIRDWHHSLKHFWETAMFIKNSDDKAEISQIVSNFSAMNSGFHGGLIVKEFIELEPLGPYPIGEIIASKEYRLLFIDGKLRLSCRYWEEFTYQIPDDLPVKWLESLAGKVLSQAFFMDVALTKGGEYKIIELGTIQFSGFDKTRINDFYEAIAQVIQERSNPVALLAEKN